jgi:hypothetical protein
MVCESGCQVEFLEQNADAILAQIEDIPGHDEVALTRKFGDEKWVYCSAAQTFLTRFDNPASVLYFPLPTFSLTPSSRLKMRMLATRLMRVPILPTLFVPLLPLLR